MIRYLIPALLLTGPAYATCLEEESFNNGGSCFEFTMPSGGGNAGGTTTDVCTNGFRGQVICEPAHPDGGGSDAAASALGAGAAVAAGFAAVTGSVGAAVTAAVAGFAAATVGAVSDAADSGAVGDAAAAAGDAGAAGD